MFIEELGWDKHKATLSIPIENRTFELSAVAEKRGMAAFVYECDGALPDYNIRRKIERQVANSAYEAMIQETATKDAPWYVVPADNKWFTRLVVAAGVIEALDSLSLEYPKVGKEKLKELAAARVKLEAG